MEAISKLQALLTNGYSVSVAVAATLAVLLKILAHITRAMDWHDKHFVRKRLSRLKDIGERSSLTAIQGTAPGNRCG